MATNILKWKEDLSYEKGDIVESLFDVYIAIGSSFNMHPPENPGYWTRIKMDIPAMYDDPYADRLLKGQPTLASGKHLNKVAPPSVTSISNYADNSIAAAAKPLSYEDLHDAEAMMKGVRGSLDSYTQTGIDYAAQKKERYIIQDIMYDKLILLTTHLDQSLSKTINDLIDNAVEEIKIDIFTAKPYKGGIE